MKNVILIGMPGAGKSTVGVVLAKVLGCSFIDGDLVIQEKTGKLLHEIISEIGADGFNKLENDINMTISPDGAVISPGGSVVYGAGAMQHYKEIGKVIFLKLPLDELERRLGDLNERGVSLKEGQTLGDLYNERLPLYEKYADYVVDCENKQLKDVVKEIERFMEENGD
jgi:shikimate kinase